MSIDDLQRYLWTMSGMRPTESQFGAMPYYRMCDVEDLVRKYEQALKDAQTNKPMEGS